MTIKRVCICANQVPFVYGGAEILVEELNTQLKNRGFVSEIINIPFKWYPKQQIINSALIWRMMDLTESDGMKIDRIICTKYPNYAINHPNKVVWLFHQHRQVYDMYDMGLSEFKNTIEDYNYVRQVKNIDNKTLLESKRIFTISQNVTNRLKKYNNIDSEVLYPPTRHEGRYYCENYENYIFVAGRLEHVKRLELMINALKYSKTDIKFVIAGKGKYEDELRKLVKKQGLSDRVLFKGFVKDEELLMLYSNAMAVYFAPIDEDYGYITIEAFKSCKPVITAKDSGGVLEFVKDGINGFVTNGKPEQIAEKVDFLFRNRDKCKEMGQKGYEEVKKIHWDSVIEKLTMEY